MTPNESGSDPVVVVGATGQQGGAVVEALLARGARVRAVVRDPDAVRAQALSDRGVDVVAGDLESMDSLRRAFEGAASGFAMTTFAGPTGTEGEVARGRILARSVAEAELPFLVYSSVGGVDRRSGVPHFDSKNRIEGMLLETQVPVAFVRPTFFMENLPAMLLKTDQGAQLSMPMPANTPLQLVSVRTIGRTAAAMLLDPPQRGTAVEIAGDELTGDEMADRISTRLNTPTVFVESPLSTLGDDEDARAMWQWFTRVPAYQADFARTRALAGDVENLMQWLARQSFDQ